MNKFTSTSLLSLAQRRWKLVLLCVIACVVLAVIVTKLQPRKYRAQAKLLVRTSRTDMVMSTEPTMQNQPPSQVTEEDVNSEIEVLRSREILDQVVTDVGLVKPTKDGARSAQTERSIMNVYGNLDISAIRKTNVIQMAYYARTPDEAVQVLRDLTSRYLTASISAHSAPNSFEFFQDQLKLARQSMVQAQEAVSNFRAQTGLSSSEQQRTELIKEQSATEAELHEAEVKLQELGSRRRSLDSQGKSVTSRVSTQVKTAVNAGVVEHLQSTLNTLENDRINLVQQYKPTDRLVQINDEKIANTRAELVANQRLGATEQTTDVNPLYQYVTKEVASNDVDTSGYFARQASLKRVQGEIQRRLGGLDKDSVTLSNLERTQQDAQDNYAVFLKRMEQARVSTQMDQQRIANVAVIEPPLSSPIPVSPSLRVNLLVGLIAGALLGFAAAWLKDSTAPSLVSEARYAVNA